MTASIQQWIDWADHLEWTIEEITKPTEYIPGLTLHECRVYGLLEKRKEPVAMDSIIAAVYWDRLPSDWPKDPLQSVRVLICRINSKFKKRIIKREHGTYVLQPQEGKTTKERVSRRQYPRIRTGVMA